MKSPGALSPRYWAAARLALVCALPLMSQGQPAKPTEYQVKAAYLANFAKFVEWPSNGSPADEPYAVCTIGADPFGPALDAALTGESVGRHPLVARRLTNAHDAAGCRVLFISGSDSDARRVLAGLDKTMALTVSDLPQFLKHGGMIQFVLEGNRVRFEVNLTAAKNAGLSLSSELLKVAAKVGRTP